MKAPIRVALIALAVALSACEPDPTEVLEPAALEEARSQRADCRPAPLFSTTSGEITADDCAFTGGTEIQYEDLYLVNQKRLGLPDLSGANMLTFTGSAPFNAIFGIGAFSGQEIFPNPVYGFSRFPANAQGAFGNSFSFIGSAPLYKMWFGGQNPSQLGSYTLTTSVEPSIDTCENGHWVFMQGDVQFSSDISNETSCRGQVQFGPNVGLPLNYQFWYYKLLPGETLNVTLTGVTPDPSIVLAAIDLGTGQSVLDFAAVPGDTDRSVTFTATRLFYLYVEVSSAPDVVAGYTLTTGGP